MIMNFKLPKVLKERSRELDGNYLNASIQDKNPLINDLINECRNRNLKFDSILCNQKMKQFFYEHVYHHHHHRIVTRFHLF
ncbi:hypothetical protein BpHYR1_004377 [Brachionus plicatilis]|uniref:Uncharacterized protein n=1 Tax=Brachionus plicatilis TaxID=10195 RepID=A0A3M7Q4D0_BRAPC|nr:hypothetical protein BpHYR1_004377 [Brachionus plicatilis]